MYVVFFPLKCSCTLTVKQNCFFIYINFKHYLQSKCWCVYFNGNILDQWVV